MSELKTIDHYLSNPDDLSGLSDEQLEALAETPEEKSEEPTEEATEEAEVKAAEDTEEETEEETEDAPEGVLSKDGKHVIPYWRLADAEERAREAAEKAEQLEQQLAERLAGKSDNQDELPEINADEIESQLEDFPELKQAFHATNARIEKLTAALTAINARSQQRELEEQRETQKDIDAAIAATPKLAYLQRTGEDGQMADPAAWDRSVEIDVMLRQQPEWKGQPYTDRFAKVVDVYEALYGPIQTSQEQPAPKKGADTKPAVPTSMSAIPGGTAPPVDELAALADKSGHELVARFMNMTPDQIEAELNRL